MCFDTRDPFMIKENRNDDDHPNLLKNIMIYFSTRSFLMNTHF